VPNRRPDLPGARCFGGIQPAGGEAVMETSDGGMSQREAMDRSFHGPANATANPTKLLGPAKDLAELHRFSRPFGDEVTPLTPLRPASHPSITASKRAGDRFSFTRYSTSNSAPRTITEYINVARDSRPVGPTVAKRPIAAREPGAWTP
jgi:hypothetical protein